MTLCLQLGLVGSLAAVPILQSRFYTPARVTAVYPYVICFFLAALSFCSRNTFHCKCRCSQEQLYSEDLPTRAAAVGRICSTLETSTNMTVLLQRPALLSVLARLLREDGRKSLDLCLGIVGLFCALSYFQQLQSNLVENQVGARTLDLLSLSIQRARLQVRADNCIAQTHVSLAYSLCLLASSWFD